MSTTWNRPVSTAYVINSPYGERTLNGKKDFHDGIDIAAPAGTPVVAARDGTVSEHTKGGCYHLEWCDCNGGFGNRVYIDHGDGYRTIYAHLTDIYVVPGEQVKAGQVIGTIGTSGSSTGNHLHFNIELNQNGSYKRINPELFILDGELVNEVSADFVPQTSNIPSSGSSTTSLSSLGASNVRNAGGTTRGKRIAPLIEQPIHAFINIRYGATQTLLATDPPRPNIIQSFEYTKIDGSGEKASISIFDDDWEVLEEILHNNYDNLYIEYGYPDTGLQSQLTKHMITDYALSFESTGVIMTLTTMTEGVYKNLDTINLELNTNNPTEAVKKICTALGYSIVDNNFDESADVETEGGDIFFRMVSEYPISYIQEYIVPHASKEGEEPYRFWIDSYGFPHFKQEEYASVSTDDMRTYIYQKGYDSPVISLDFESFGVFGGSDHMQIATEYKSSIFDPNTKEEHSYTVNRSSAATVATGNKTFTRSDQSSAQVDLSGYNASQQKAQLWYYMKTTNDAYKANMTIVGDPSLKLFEYVRIINITDKGRLHHSSGVYQIKGIIDIIENGIMHTKLELYKNAHFDMNGVEIINPKTLIK